VLCIFISTGFTGGYSYSTPSGLNDKTSRASPKPDLNDMTYQVGYESMKKPGYEPKTGWDYKPTPTKCNK
jgi:hypothetical protein